MTNRQLFQIVSDLHIPQDDSSTPKWTEYIQVSAPYLIIAGDIGRVEKTMSYMAFLMEVCQQYTHVFLIAGNHEYYSSTKTFEFLNSELKCISNRISNLTFLDDSYFDLPGNIRIYGSTLWSAVSNSPIILPIQSCLGTAGDQIWMNKMHYNALYNLQNQLDESRRLKKRLIVVTHYPPTVEQTVLEKHKKSSRLTFYANNLDTLLTKESVYIWVYGHTHVNADYRTDMDTRVVSNQFRGKNWIRNKVLNVRER